MSQLNAQVSHWRRTIAGGKTFGLFSSASFASQRQQGQETNADNRHYRRLESQSCRCYRNTVHTSGPGSCYISIGPTREENQQRETRNQSYRKHNLSHFESLPSIERPGPGHLERIQITITYSQQYMAKKPICQGHFFKNIKIYNTFIAQILQAITDHWNSLKCRSWGA